MENSKFASGESYNASDTELIRQLVKSRLEQKHELEYEDLTGYVLPPRTQFSMTNKPQVTFYKDGKMKFNMACIRLFEGVQHIYTIFNEEKRRMAVVMCAEEEGASVEWARKRTSDDEWVNKDITSRKTVNDAYSMMHWVRTNRYKALGRVVNSDRGLILVFELDEAVMYVSEKTEEISEKTGKPKIKQVVYYPDKYKDTMGQSFTDYLEARQINLFEVLEEYETNTYSDAPKPNVDELPEVVHTYSTEDESLEKQSDEITERNGETQEVASTQYALPFGTNSSGVISPNGYGGEHNDS